MERDGDALNTCEMAGHFLDLLPSLLLLLSLSSSSCSSYEEREGEEWEWVGGRDRVRE